MSVFLMSPNEVASYIAKRVQSKRLSYNLSQQTLSERSGVSYGALKKFERTGKISLEGLLKIALVLEALEDFSEVFRLINPEKVLSINDLLKDNSRKRGRK